MSGRGLEGRDPVHEAPLIDVVARALVLPVSRRRTIGLISGALLAGAAWRPKLAHAAWANFGRQAAPAKIAPEINPMVRRRDTGRTSALATTSIKGAS